MSGSLYRLVIATNVGLALLLTAGVVVAQTPENAQPPTPKVSTTVSTTTDYLVRVGKHTMWKSQVEKMHPELKAQIIPISKKNGNDFLVLVGKQTVWAST